MGIGDASWSIHSIYSSFPAFTPNAPHGKQTPLIQTLSRQTHSVTLPAVHCICPFLASTVRIYRPSQRSPCPASGSPSQAPSTYSSTSSLVYPLTNRVESSITAMFGILRTWLASSQVDYSPSGSPRDSWLECSRAFAALEHGYRTRNVERWLDQAAESAGDLNERCSSDLPFLDAQGFVVAGAGNEARTPPSGTKV